MITEEHAKELDALLKRCLDNDDKLTQWENDFVSDFTDRLEKYKNDIRISDKQHAVFMRIKGKLDEAGV